jgi:hypothetical protein
MISNYNKIKKDRKGEVIRPSHSNENKFLYITNFKNINKKTFSCKKQNDKEEKKNNINISNNNISKESIPNILQIQKLLKCLQNQNNTRFYRNDINKENNKLPNLINKIKPHSNDIKPLIIKHKKKGINNNGSITVCSINDVINKVNCSNNEINYINNNKIDNNKLNKNINDNNNNNNNNYNKIKKKNSIKRMRMPKVIINRVMNIFKETLIVNNNGNDEKIVNIRLKSNQKLNMSYFYSYNNNNVAKNKKDNVNFCVSNYNNFKSDLMSLKKTFHHLENERTKKETLVNKNKTMFKNPFYEKKYNEESEDYEEKENDSKRYSKYYLPSSGFGLLSRYNNN